MTGTDQGKVELLQRGVRLLAALDPDRASVRNDVGYSAGDGAVGHALAVLPDEAWDAEVQELAHALLWRYQRQLAEHGVDIGGLGRPSSAPDRVRRRVLEATAGRRALDRALQSITVTSEGDRLLVRFRYHAELVRRVRQVPGRRWDPVAKAWVIPAASAGALEAALRGEPLPEASAGAAPAPEVRQAAAALVGGAAAGTEGRAPTIGTVSRDADRFVVRFPYDPELVRRIRQVPGRRWDPVAKAWTVPANPRSAEALVGILGPHGVLTETVAAAERRAEASRALDGGERRIVGMAEGLELLPFQAAGVAYARAVRRALIADEMGLGKTIQALATVVAEGATPAVAVVPASMKRTWAREATRWFPALDVEVIEGTRRCRIRPADLVVVNYDILAARLADLVALRPRALVLDESHYIKNRGSRSRPVQRTKAALELAAAIPADGLVLALSGTPILQRPVELVPQLEALGVLGAFGGAWSFLQRYCGAVNNGWGWDFSGASHTDELHELLRRTCMVRRAKADVLPELPPRRHAPVWLEPTPGPALEAYRRAEADVVAYLAERAAELAAAAGEDPDSAAWEARLRAEAARHLVAVTTLRRLAAEAKLAQAVAWVRDALEGRPKVVVFAHHVEVLDRLAAELADLEPVMVRGDVSGEARQAAVDRFQTDPACRVFLGQIAAAGVGLTLTAATDVVFVEGAWTPAAHDQAIDRCHGRLNDPRGAVGWYLLAEGTIDEAIWALLDRKRRVVDAVTDGVRREDDGSVVGSLLVQLARRGLADRKREVTSV
jgi:hypothetical protein